MANLAKELESIFTECKANGMHCFYIGETARREVEWGWISDGTHVLSVSVPHPCDHDWHLSYAYKPTENWGTGCVVFDSFYDETFKRPYKHIEKNYEWIKSFMHVPNFRSYPCGRTEKNLPRLYEDMEEWKKSKQNFYGDKFTEF